MRNILVSSSGGRTSMLMAKLMKESPDYSNDNLFFVFANTGKEFPETLDFCHKCDQRFGLNLVWLEAKVNPVIGVGTGFKVVTHETASREGGPFEDMIKKYGIPNAAYPHCSRELKIAPIHSWAKSMFGKDYICAIGIRFDEIRRANRRDGFIYPMIDWQMTVRNVREFWNSQDFDLKLKDYEGNCEICWKKSLRKILTIVKDRPKITDWWKEMEAKYSMLQLDSREHHAEPVHFNRKNMSIQEIEALSHSDFVPATDVFWQYNAEMDDEQACQCMNDQRLLELEY